MVETLGRLARASQCVTGTHLYISVIPVGVPVSFQQKGKVLLEPCVTQMCD